MKLPRMPALPRMPSLPGRLPSVSRIPSGSSFSPSSFRSVYRGNTTDLIESSKRITNNLDNSSLDSLKNLKKANGENVFSDDTLEIFGAHMTKKQNNVTALSTKLDEAVASGDPKQIQKASDDLNRAVKQFENSNKGFRTVADTMDDATVKRLTKAAEKSADNVVKTGGFCKKNLQMCVMGGLAAATGAYYSLEAYNDLEKEKKECLNLCYPEDYRNAIDEGRTPTYKTENAVSPSDPNMRYTVLYPELEDMLCTPENMTKEGASDCDDFCKTNCDYDLDDIFETMATNAGGDIRTGLDATLTSLLGDKWKMYVIIFFVILCVLIMLPLLLKLVL